jgi:hypothetical protein
MAKEDQEILDQLVGPDNCRRLLQTLRFNPRFDKAPSTCILTCFFDQPLPYRIPFEVSSVFAHSAISGASLGVGSAR